MAEIIDNIVSREAIESLENLNEHLRSCINSMDELGDAAMNAMKNIQNGGMKAVSEGMEKMQKLSVEVVKTESKRLNIERELYAEGQKMSKVIDEEGKMWEKTGKAMEQVSLGSGEQAKNIVYLTQQIDANKAAQKGLKESLKEGSISQSEYEESMAKLVVQHQQYKVELSESQMALKSQMKEVTAIAGSYDEMNAKLGQMRDAYRQLSEEERNSEEIGGTLLQGIQSLDEKLKAIDKTMGNNQRNVGNYEIAAKSMREIMRGLREEIFQQLMANKELGKSIEEQRTKVEGLAATEGTSSQAYRDAAASLGEMERQYAQNAATIEEMTQNAGEMDDTISDLNQNIKSAGQDAQGWVAASQGMNLVANGYTAIQAGMAMVGAESKDLMQVYAKVQLVQQGINAVQKIALGLQKQTVLMTKLRATWDKIVLAVQKKKVAATTAEAAATASATAAEKAKVAQDTKNAASSTAAAASISGLSAANTAATATSSTLVVALKAVGAAIKSIPIIGWILAVISALGTVIGLIVSANEQESEGERIQRQKEERQKAINKAKVEALESSVKETMELDRSLKALKKCKKGTEEYERAVGKTAKMLGVSADWIKENEDKVDALAAAWKRVKLAQAQQDAFMKAAAEADVNLAKADLARAEMLSASAENRRQTVEDWAEFFGWSEDQVDDMVQYLNDARTDNEKKYRKAINNIDDMIGREKDNFVATKNAMVKRADAAADSIVSDENAIAAAVEKSSKSAEKAKKQVKSVGSTVGTVAEAVSKIAEIKAKTAELEAQTEEQQYTLKRERLNGEMAREIELHKNNAEAKIAIEKYYGLMIAQLDAEHEKNRLNVVKKATTDMLNALDSINEAKLRKSGISEEQLTEALVDLAKERSRRVREANNASMKEELSQYDENSAEYVAVKAKWDAIMLKQTQDEVTEEQKIRMKGYSDAVARIRQTLTDTQNQLVIDTNGAATQSQLRNAEIEGYRAEIAELEKYKDSYESLGMTKEEYTSKMLELNAKLVKSSKEQTDYELANVKAQKEARKELALAVSESVVSIAKSFSFLIKDERERVIVEQSLALAQVSIEQGVAIAKAISLAIDKSISWADAAAKIVVAVGAVMSNIATAINSINSASNNISSASAYAEGTEYHNGGAAVIGEGGSPELVIAGNRKFVVEKPTYFPTLPVGAQVIPLDGRHGTDISPILASMEEMKRHGRVEVNVGRDVYGYIVSGATRTRIINRQFSH